MSPTLISLDAPSSWPEPVLQCLEAEYELFLAWEKRHDGHEAPSISGKDYDRAIFGLQAAIQPYSLVGLHCSRLTDEEIARILAEGMQLPNLELLHGRIADVEKAGLLSPKTAACLRKRNQANDANRAGMIWFCFFPPYIAGRGAIERLFRSWGGEALYNSHENDPVTGSALRGLGRPCLVEAIVPISSLEPYGGLESKIVRRYLIHRGYSAKEPVDHEDRAKKPIPAECIRRVIRFPEPDFVALTQCDVWSIPLT